MKSILVKITHYSFFVFSLLLSLQGFSQNTGIGTSTPTGKLTVTDISETAVTIKTPDNTSNSGLAFQNSGNNYVWNIFRSGAGDGNAHLVFAGGNNQFFVQNLTERMRLTNIGRLGIGTSTPNDLLEVWRTGTAGIKVTATSPCITLNDINGKMWFLRTDNLDFHIVKQPIGTLLLLQQGTGRVGIDTESPQATLDVNYDFKLGTNGTVLRNIAKITRTANLPQIPNGDYYWHEFMNVPGADANNTSIFISPVEDLPGAVYIRQTRIGSFGSSVYVKFINEGSNNQNPPEMDFYIAVINTRD